MQAHNRHNSMSFYLAAIATIDTAALTVGESVYLHTTTISKLQLRNQRLLLLATENFLKAKISTCKALH